jgi:hypothetical protein
MVPLTRFVVVGALSAAAVVASGVGSPRNATAAIGPGVSTLVDSGGQAIGPFAVLNGETAIVTLLTPGRRIAVPVSSAGFGGQFPGYFPIAYASNDCTGTPYVPFTGSDLGAVADGGAIGVSAGKLLYATGRKRVYGQMHSWQNRPAGADPTTDPALCNVGDIPPNGAMAISWGLAKIYDLNRFVPPFHVE